MRPSLAPALALALALLAVPLASAQLPDPGAVVDQACATVRGPAPDVANAVPLCPRDPPPAPADPAAQHDHQHDPAPVAPPANPQDAQSLAGEVVGQAQQVPQDPSSAPNRVLVIVESIVQFVKDVLHAPAVGAHAVALGAHDAAAKVGAATHHATAALGSALDAAKAKVAGLFHHAPAAPSKLPRVKPGVQLPHATKNDVLRLARDTKQAAQQTIPS